ncbi:MAG: TolC family protein, partial [Planctomycetota bacterium]|nr:TolC family protein [Planctomycetota bacterium]
LSGGGYGGGAGDRFANFDGRSDLDALAVWELENLGFGNRARQREVASQQRQRSLEVQRVRDVVAAQVTQAYHRARIAPQRVNVAREQVEAAAEAIPLNFRGIRGGRLRPIEAQQAVTQLFSARERYLIAVTDHNRSQLRLLYAVGNPVSPATASTLPIARSEPVPPAPAPE